MDLKTTSVRFRVSLVAIICLAAPALITAGEQTNPVTTRNQQDTPADEKRSRTPAQRKIDTQLLYAIKQRRGETRGIPTQRIEIKLDASGKVIVDITAAVTSRVVPRIQALDGVVISMSQKYHTIRAAIALDKLESLAASKHVRYISLPAEAMTHGGAVMH